LEKLLPQPSKENTYKGCELIMPETVMFKAGKPKFYIRTDNKDFCVVG